MNAGHFKVNVALPQTYAQECSNVDNVEAECIQTAVTKGLKIVTAYMMPKWLTLRLPD